MNFNNIFSPVYLKFQHVISIKILMRLFCILFFPTIIFDIQCTFSTSKHICHILSTQKPNITHDYYIGQCSSREFFRGKGLGVALRKPGHPLHSLVNFEMAVLLPWKTFPNFRVILKSIYPQDTWLLFYAFFFGFFS